MGVCSIFWGDKDVGDEGKITKIFEWPKGRAKNLKLVYGVVFIALGVKALYL
jgi:hypothetical protein